MKVKELIIQLLNEDMDAKIVIGLGEYKKAYALIDGITSDDYVWILPEVVLGHV